MVCEKFPVLNWKTKNIKVTHFGAMLYHGTNQMNYYDK